MARKNRKFHFKINPELRREIFGIIILALAVFTLISLVSFRPSDSSFFQVPPSRPPQNLGGLAGVHLSSFLFHFFGWSVYLVPLLLAIWGWRKFRKKESLKLFLKAFGVLLILVAMSIFFQTYPLKLPSLGFLPGGLLGAFFNNRLNGFLGQAGVTILILTFLLLGIILSCRKIFVEVIFYFFMLLWKIVFTLVKFLWFLSVSSANELKAAFCRIKELWKQRRTEPTINLPPKIKRIRQEEEKRVEQIKTQKKKPARMQEKELKEKAEPGLKPFLEYRIPLITLLSEPPAEKPELKNNLKEQAKVLEETLSNFGIKVKVTQINRGPVITEYELQPAPGIKVNRIVGLADNIALAMRAPSVRVVAPIPGKAVVGIEIPNRVISNVFLREIISHPDYEKSTSKLTLALGKDISGRPLINDLTDMPHLLIAGTTGSGKTICINTIITSILFKATPDEVKFILIDPKRVELINFNNLPHLITPVVTSAKKAAAVLKWLVEEMERRYKMFAGAGIRNIEGFNKKDDSLLPYIVVVIDELADLMMTVSMEVEEAITRLAQLSRAVGIHIVLATQRPSVDVITGVIKANFPSRISFQVSSKVDSRTVLDMNGAETLLGKGDMLFLPPGLAKPIRAQGALINDQEIEGIIGFIGERARPVYNEDIFIKSEKEEESSLGSDELFEQAVKVVLESGQASASVLQRRLRVGYARAARLIDMMEEKEIVGQHRGSRPREILVDPAVREGKKNE